MPALPCRYIGLTSSVWVCILYTVDHWSEDCTTRLGADCFILVLTCSNRLQRCTAVLNNLGSIVAPG